MKKSVFAFILLLTLTLSSQTAKAWWDAGHMAVAQIAYNELKSDTRLWADSLISLLPGTGLYPWARGFVEAATYPDDIKGDGVRVYDSWHYTNIPLNDEKVEISCNDIPPINVVWAIGQARAILGSSKTTNAEKSHFLAFLIHFVGDLHQPLHSTSMYTKAMPEGDRGGNNFLLNDTVHKNMHGLWDDGCGYFDTFGKVERKLGPASWKTAIEKIAKSVTKAYPQSSLPLLGQLDPAYWAEESHFYAINAGYKGLQNESGGRSIPIKANDIPSESYLREGKKIVEMRVAMAGYRLAMVIEECYRSKMKK